MTCENIRTSRFTATSCRAHRRPGAQSMTRFLQLSNTSCDEDTKRISFVPPQQGITVTVSILYKSLGRSPGKGHTIIVRMFSTSIRRSENSWETNSTSSYGGARRFAFASSEQCRDSELLQAQELPPRGNGLASSMREARYIHYGGIGKHKNRQHIERHDFVLRSESHAM